MCGLCVSKNKSQIVWVCVCVCLHIYSIIRISHMTQTQKHYINLETFNVTKQYNEQTIHFWSTTINAKLKAASQILRF